MATKTTTKTKKTTKAETTKGKTTKTTKTAKTKATKATKTAKAKATKTAKETKPKTTKTTKAKATTKTTKAKTTKTTKTTTTKTTKTTKPKTSKATKTTKTKTTTKAKATTTKPKATKTTKTAPKTTTKAKTTTTKTTPKTTPKTTKATPTTPKAKTTKPTTSLKKHPIHIITFIDGIKSPSKCAQKNLPDLLDHLLDWSKQMDNGRSYYAYRKERSEKLHQNIDEFWAEIIKTLRLYEIYAWPLSGHPETGKPYRLGVLKTKDTDVVGLCHSPVHDHDGNVLPLDAIETMIQEKITQLNTK